MNICFIAATYHPVIGGGETYVKTLAEGLVSSGENVFVITDNVKGCSACELLNGVYVYRCDGYNKLLNRSDKIKWEQMYFSVLTDIKEYIEGKSIDVLHANSFETSIIGSFISKELNIPLVCTYHEVRPEEEAFGVGKCRVVFQNPNVDAFIASSRFYFNKALEYEVAKERLNLIYHGIDIYKYENSLNKRQYKKNNDFMVLCAARIKERKGIKELIEATSILIDEIPNLKVVICGTVNSGSEKYFCSILELIKQLKLEHYVEIYTGISHDEMANVFKETDIVIQPSYYEGLGIAILEGMASGKPVIASDTLGLNEIIINQVNGLLIKPRDVNEIANAIIMLKEDEGLRRKISTNGYRMAKERFSITRVIKETRQLYLKVIRERK